MLVGVVTKRKQWRLSTKVLLSQLAILLLVRISGDGDWMSRRCPGSVHPRLDELDRSGRPGGQFRRPERWIQSSPPAAPRRITGSARRRVVLASTSPIPASR